MNYKKALIFGIDSFTGEFLKTELEKNNIQVFGTNLNGVDNYIKCDVTKINECYEAILNCLPDYIVNLTGISFVPSIDYLEIYNVNFIGSLNILKACEEYVPKSKLLLISSAQVYKESLYPLQEKDSIELKNHYAISKKNMEDVIFLSNYNCKIARSFNYTGIGQDKKFLIPKIVDHYKNKNSSITLGDIDVFRDFSDVRDVVRAYKYILLSDSKDCLFNVCSSRAVSIQEILLFLDTQTKQNITVLESEKFKRSKITKKIVGNNELLKSIGWNSKYQIEDTLIWMLNY